MPSNNKNKSKTVVKKPRSKNKTQKKAKSGSELVQTKEIRTTTRKLKPPHYSMFHIGKRIKPVRPKISGSFRLFWRACQTLFRHWKHFLILSLIYGFFDLLFVHGIANSLDLASVKTSLLPFLGNHPGKVSTGLTLFVYLLGNSNNSTSAGSGIFEAILIILMSLVIIWSLRQIYNGNVIKVRQSFYNSTYPLVAFIVVLLVIALQLIPFLIGASIYGTVLQNGIAVHFFEQVLWLLGFVLVSLISFYMVCSSIFALYIATLPNMTPMKALRSARQLVRYRRFVVLRKLLFLPLILFVIVAVIMIPVIIVVAPIASWLLFCLSILGLVVIHSYIYALYKELLT